MRSDDELRTIIDDAARRTFDPHLLAGLTIERNVDQDGDPIFWITIVVEDGFLALDSGITTGFLVALRSELIDVGELAFPVVNYVLRREDEKRRVEAA